MDISTTPANTPPLPLIREHIVVMPDRCGGKPHIAGRRIKVQDIALWHERLGMSPDEIVAEYPDITLADVYAALAYYCDHRETIGADIRADNQFVADLFAHAPPSLLRQRLGIPDATGHPLPPR